MKWTEYPTKADWNKRENGIGREGQELAAAPGGARWAIMIGGRYAKVHRGHDFYGNEILWSLKEENQ